ncbi:hypothetical protein FB451DRAFT_1079765 [Mycena latifolia]|nr:hypothetical protein FB451DRAFT_1079765 [Mycena latifolia]
MSDHSLPDEIISEILSPALKMSDEMFSDTSDVSPFAEYSESCSAYLLVCKSWLRVATPLLYHVVILRSKAQANALRRVLTENNDLGRLIKKLRVEGGYGPSMSTIMQFSPNISDLFISFDIYSSDDTSGLCAGLTLINPRRVVLHDPSRTSNKMISNLGDALIKAIPQWDHLTICDLPSGLHRATQILQALAKSQRLTTVVVSYAAVSWVYSALKDCPLQAIWIKETSGEAYRMYWRSELDPTLQALLRFKENPPVADRKSRSDHLGFCKLPDIAPLFNPFFIPMSDASNEVKDAIWKRVLYFAMSVPELEQDTKAKAIPRRLPILLVSRMFNRLALPFFYAHTVIKNSADTSRFFTVFSGMKLESESFRRLVLPRTVEDPHDLLETHGSKFIELHIWDHAVQSLNGKSGKIFELCSNLKTIFLECDDAPPEPWEFDPSRRRSTRIQTASSLVTMHINLNINQKAWRPYKARKNSLNSWGTFFNLFEPERFPRLREIHVSCCEWPTNEREIGKSRWVQWAERLLEHNINLIDGSGKKWRPRLKVK